MCVVGPHLVSVYMPVFHLWTPSIFNAGPSLTKPLHPFTYICSWTSKVVLSWLICTVANLKRIYMFSQGSQVISKFSVKIMWLLLYFYDHINLPISSELSLASTVLHFNGILLFVFNKFSAIIKYTLIFHASLFLFSWTGLFLLCRIFHTCRVVCAFLLWVICSVYPLIAGKKQ